MYINYDFIRDLNKKFENSKMEDLDLLQEECAELIQAASKVKREEKNAINKLIEEMTHVLYMIEKTSTNWGITQSDIDSEVKKKSEKYGLEHDNLGIRE